MDAMQPEETASRRDRLLALRGRLEQSLQMEIPVRELAAISREYRACLADIAALPDAQEVSVADEIAERRARRRAASSRDARAEGAR